MSVRNVDMLWGWLRVENMRLMCIRCLGSSYFSLMSYVLKAREMRRRRVGPGKTTRRRARGYYFPKCHRVQINRFSFTRT